MEPVEVEHPETPLNPPRVILMPRPPRRCKIRVIVLIVVAAAIIGVLAGIYLTTHLFDSRTLSPKISVGPMVIENFPVDAKSDRATWNATLAINNQNLKSQIKLFNCLVKLLFNDEEVSHTGCSNGEPFQLEPNEALEVYASSNFDTVKMWRERGRGTLTLGIEIKVSTAIISKGEEGPNENVKYLCDNLEMKFTETTGKTSDVYNCIA